MLILDVKSTCFPANGFEEDTRHPLQLGLPGTLCIFCLLQGSGTLQQNEHALVLQAGQIVTAQGGAAFTPLQPCHLVGVSLTGSIPGAVYAGLHLPECIPLALCPTLPNVLRSLGQGAALPPQQASALAYSLLCQLAQTPQQKAALPPLVAGAVAHIHQHYADVYGIEELAEEMGVTKSHLVRCFTAAVGMPPGKYLTTVRLEAAKGLLLHREYPLEVVANLSGFSGANYFCKVFKKQTGQTPAAWRQANMPSSPLPPHVAQQEDLLYL